MTSYGIVYLIRHLDGGKVYVGQTTRALAKRWYQHCRDAKKGRPHPLHAAIRKHGNEAFSICMLAECDDRDALNRCEAQLIAEHRSCERGVGYNVRIGGDGGGPHSAETRRKQSIAKQGKPAHNKGKKMQEAQRLQMIARMRANPRTGHVLSAETKAKIGAANSKSLLGNVQSETTREKRGIALKMHWSVPANKERRRAAGMGRVVSAETRAKIRMSNLGQTRSEETRMRILQARLNYLQRTSRGNS